ncbi:MAG: regulatory protein RecX [Pseudomonadota bacterium]
MGLLARREHSQVELVTKLRRRGFDSTVVDQVVAALAEAGLQSDDRFAEAFAASRRSRGYGPLKILAELRNRGIRAPKLADILPLSDREWVDDARALRCRRFGDAPPEDAAERARQTRFLERRGYSQAQARQAFRAER